MKKLFLLASVILAVTFSPLALADKLDRNRTTPAPRQQTIEEVIIEKNSYVRPYLPKKIVGRGGTIGGCDPDGNIIPATRGGGCFDVRSVDGKQAWRMRAIIHGAVDRVWKIQNNKPVLWAVFDTNNGNVVTFASSEAQQFATAHGLTPQDSPAQAPTNAPYSPLPAPAATNPVENILKNGVTDLLKGLGR